MKITLAKSAGFCFGVKRAVDTVYEQLEMSAAERQPIYTFGPIIHNEEVVRDLEEKGVTVLESVEELEDLPVCVKDTPPCGKTQCRRGADRNYRE